jgi:hypothetical protein
MRVVPGVPKLGNSEDNDFCEGREGYIVREWLA